MGQIRDIMCKDVITIETDKNAADAAKIISDNDICFLVIMSDGLPLGVLSEKDFVRKISAENKERTEKNDEQYEGASYYIYYMLSSTSEFITIGISYIPIVSHAKELLNSLLNITLGLIGLYIGYKIFALTIFNSIL